MPNPPMGFTIIDNAIPDPQQIIDWLEERGMWQQSMSVGASDPNVRTSQTQFLEMMSFANPTFVYEMNKAVWSAMNEYAKEWHFSFYNIEQASAQKYEGDQHYEVHVDHSANMQNPRVCSAVLYLNTVKQGGETHFPKFDYKIKPVAGRLAIFPANYIYAHAALPVTSGTKYAIAYWANG